MRISKDAYSNLLNQEETIQTNSRLTQEKLLKIMEDFDYVSLDKLVSITGYSKERVSSCLLRMYKNGSIIRITAVTPTHYCLPSKKLTSNGTGISFSILKFAEKKPSFSINELEQTLSKKGPELMYALKVLVSHRVLTRVSKGKYIFNGLKYLKTTPTVPTKTFKKETTKYQTTTTPKATRAEMKTFYTVSQQRPTSLLSKLKTFFSKPYRREESSVDTTSKIELVLPTKLKNNLSKISLITQEDLNDIIVDALNKYLISNKILIDKYHSVSAEISSTD